MCGRGFLWCVQHIYKINKIQVDDKAPKSISLVCLLNESCIAKKHSTVIDLIMCIL